MQDFIRKKNSKLTENYMVEQPAINWLKKLGYSYIHGSELCPDNSERASYRDVILKKRFIDAIKRINPWIDDRIAEEVYKRVSDISHPDFVLKSKIFYDYLTQGVKVIPKGKGDDRARLVKTIDFENIENNEFLVANQFTVEYQFEKGLYRRPDIVVFINGIPLAVFELKSFNANETAKDAFNDHKIKIKDIPQLYIYAQVLVASDGLETKYGSSTSDWERFFVWEGIFSDDDVKIEEIDDEHYKYTFNGEEITSLQLLINGLFRKEHFIEYLRDFIFFLKSGETYNKMIAMYHQFYTVRKAIERTKKCVLEGKNPEEKRIGVVWHTQGSGKSFTMLLYARKALIERELKNPLLLFITDRKNLDEQLYGLFSQLSISKRAESIKDLQETIKTYAGGIVFATIQKFGKKKAEEYPFLTDRENVIVIADEAHRSQYRELAQNLRRAIPNASFMGFTATPVELRDKDTYLVFGDPISIYSIDKARRHRVVVPIYYEARLSSLHLTNEFIDEEFEEISEFMSEDEKESVKRKFARLENLIMVPERLESIADDIVNHFNNRIKDIDGKAMVVTISRKVAVKLYEEIIKHPDAPSVAVVISGNKQRDPEEFWPHIRNKRELDNLLSDFKNPERAPKMVIVVDMLLTGFDVPCLHTMYFDKPMKGYSLVQAIARVNRVFKDKPGGLIVDYIGIADNLRKSLRIYTMDTVDYILSDISKIIDLMKEKYDVVSSMFHGLDYSNWQTLIPEQLATLTTKAYSRISDDDSRKRFVKNYLALKKLYALASPHPETIKIKNDIKFFEMIKKMIVKYSTGKSRDISRDLEYELNQLISKSIAAEEPVDVFSMLKKDKPDISMLDDSFLAQFEKMEYKNYAADILMKIINDELKVRMKKNPIRYRSLYEMLMKIIEKYNIRLIDTADVIQELIEIAREIRKNLEEGNKLDLSEEELAFYDLLNSRIGTFEDSDELKKVVKEILKELNPYIRVADWNKKDSIRAKIKMIVKKSLISIVNSKMSYEEIDNIASEVLSQIEVVYAIAA
ncbi:MAG: type I restriction endonuclease subunit R [Candidatus Desulfofervidaceae bacterium]|nr:type I restriction endonuclease subunit R [Candidatus Desulfofervidaceae bacterium]